MVQPIHSKAEREVYIDELADQLGETRRVPRIQIARIVNKAGVEFARAIYQLTLETEAQGADAAGRDFSIWRVRS